MRGKLFLLIFLLPFFGKGQGDTLENKYLLNFVIPDMPAYKSLGIENSKLLRPSDVKEFSLMLSPFFNNGKGAIPKNFGLEFAPWKIASKTWTLSDYNTKSIKRFFYNSSFSIASAVDSTDYPSKISIGYRFSVLSKAADVIRIAFNNSSEFSVKAEESILLKTYLKAYWISQVVKPLVPAIHRDEYFDTHQKEFYSFLASIDPSNPSLSNQIKALILDTRRIFGEDFDFKQFEKLTFEDVRGALIQKLITEYKNKNWNAARLDAAIAWVGESKDSVVSNSRFSSFNVWITSALKLGQKGQLLIGSNLRLPNSAVDSFQHTPINFVGSVRLLMGNSDFRFFGESQWESINYGFVKNTILLNIGGELRISDKFWIVANSGVENLKSRETEKWFNRIVANMDIRYGFNFK
jgi:hypothetical protein